MNILLTSTGLETSTIKEYFTDISIIKPRIEVTL